MLRITLISIIATIIAVSQSHTYIFDRYTCIVTQLNAIELIDSFLQLFPPTPTHVHKEIALNIEPVVEISHTTISLTQTQLTTVTCGSLLVPVIEYVRTSRGYTANPNDQHLGIDLVAPMGSLIIAAESGIVKFIGWYSDYGRIIDIQHEDDVVTRYAHLKSFAPNLKVGQTVTTGQTIGQVGVSGHSTGPHVHFEVRVKDRPVDPAPWLGLSRCRR